MNIFDYTRVSLNKYLAKTNYGREDKPNITFNGDKFFYSYADKKHVVLSNGILNGDKTIELKAIYNLSNSKTGKAVFSHFEKSFEDSFESTTLFYKSIDDVVNNRLYRSVTSSFEQSEKSTSKKVSQKQYKLNSNNKPVCFFVRDTCTNKINADTVRGLFNIKKGIQPLTRTIKTITTLRNMSLDENISMDNFKTLTNETKIKYRLGDKKILSFKEFDTHSSKGDSVYLKKSGSFLRFAEYHKGKIIFENDNLKEATGNLAVDFLNQKKNANETNKIRFDRLVKSYCYPNELQDVCSLHNNIKEHIEQDQSKEDFLEDKFFCLGFSQDSHYISKFDIHSSMLQTINNFEETLDLFDSSTNNKDNNLTYSDLGFSVNK